MADTSGPAFPVDVGTQPLRGLTKREYFAAQALASILQDRAIWDSNAEERREIATRMFGWADAMIEASKRPPEGR